MAKPVTKKISARKPAAKASAKKPAAKKKAAKKPAKRDMSYYFTVKDSVKVVQSRSGKRADKRTKFLVDTLVKHMHAFVKEARPTMDEWMYGINYLTRVGHMCNDWRQEFILLSDVLGISMLALGGLGGGSGMGPLGYFVYQAVFLNLLLVASVWMHNAANRRMADAIDGGARG